MLPQWRTDLLSLAAGLQTDQSHLMGAFSSVFGPQNLAVLVWRHRDIDRADQVSGQLQTSPAGRSGLVVRVGSSLICCVTAGQAFLAGVMSVDSKLMSPQPFSPWK